MNQPSKPFNIDKRQVYEAYLQVRSNSGAAGVDGVTIEQFESNLKGNLYKIWNRMSSGAYFPPPVRAVSIPKKKWRPADPRSSDRGGSCGADRRQTAD